MEIAGEVSTILAAFAALIAILVGSRQFSETQRLTRETQAVELLVRFNELGIDRDTDDPNRRFWACNARLTITESVHHLTVGDKTWDATVHWMIRTQKNFLNSTRLYGSTYSDSFREILSTSGVTLIEPTPT